LRLPVVELEAGTLLAVVARIEPENNTETILNGFTRSSSEKKFLVIGNVNNSFGQKLQKKFQADKRIVFGRSYL